MIKNFVLTSLALIFAIFVTYSSTTLAYDPTLEPCKSNPNADICQPDNPDNPVVDVISNIANLTAFIGGAIAVIMVIYGGYLYITSAGDSGKVSKAKSTITWALIGVAVIALSYLIISIIVKYFVIS